MMMLNAAVKLLQRIEVPPAALQGVVDNDDVMFKVSVHHSACFNLAPHSAGPG